MSADIKTEIAPDEFTPEEQAFFESGGEKEIPSEPAQEAKAEEPEQPETEEPAGEDRERDGKGRYVPHGALHAEREEHKKTRAELDQLRQYKAVMDDRWTTLQQMRQEQPEAHEEQAPDPNVDIFAAFNWQRKQLEALQTKINDGEVAQRQAAEESQREQQVWNYWKADAEQYSKTNADFNNAATWLADLRDKQLTALSAFDQRFSTKQGRDIQIDAELKDIVVKAAQAKMSPAEMIYQLAQGYGYQKAPPQTDPVPDKLEMPETLRKVEQGLQSSRTVGQASGKSGSDQLSPEAIANMPAPEFDAWIKVPANERYFNSIMGG